jgi:hypothetical protein
MQSMNCEFGAYVSGCQRARGLLIMRNSMTARRAAEEQPDQRRAAEQPDRRRWPIVALALVAASLFAISVQAGVWWTAGEVEIGPFGSHACFAGDCRTAGLRWLGGSEAWLRGAIATGAAGLVAMLALVVLAGAIAASPRGAARLGTVGKHAAKASLVAIATAVIAGAWFVIGFPGVGGAHFDRGAVFYAIAVAVGIVAAIRALRWR